MSRIRKYLPVAVAATFIAGAAQAATLNLVHQGDDLWGAPALEQDVFVTMNKTRWGVGAGVMQLMDTVSGSAITAFCIDVTRWITDPPGAYESKASWYSAPVTAKVQALFNTAYAKVTDAASAAGFQMALWEIVTESAGNPLSLSSGTFRATGTTQAVAHAKDYLAGLSGATTQKYHLTFLESLTTDQPGYGQDLIGVAPVPLPASVLLLGGAIAGMGALRRRQKNA